MKNIILYIFLHTPFLLMAQIQQEWQFNYSYQHEPQTLIDQVVDQDNNILLLIASRDSVFWDTDALILKINPDGQLLWQQAYQTDSTLSPFHHSEMPRRVLVDANQQVYVLGTQSTTNHGTWHQDLFLLKYTSTGQLDWIQTYDEGQTSKITINDAIIVNEKLLITGSAQINGNNFMVTLCFELQTGILQWKQLYKTASTQGIGQFIRANSQQKIYIGGTLSTIDNTQVVILVYTATGELLDTLLYQSKESNYTEIAGMEFNDFDHLNVYTSNYNISNETIINQSSDLLSYLPNHEQIWAVHKNNISALDMKIDQSNHIIIADKQVDGGSLGQKYVSKYNEAGQLIWTNTLNKAGSGIWTVIDQNNYLYAQIEDCLLYYTPEGNVFWQENWQEVSLTGRFFDQDNYLYAISYLGDNNNTISLIKLKTPLSFLTSIPTNTTPNPALQVHYQPIHQQTTFTITNSSILEAQNTHLQLYNIQGQLVDRYTLNSGSLIISTAQWQSGLYVGTLVVDGEKVETVSFSVVQ